MSRKRKRYLVQELPNERVIGTKEKDKDSSVLLFCFIIYFIVSMFFIIATLSAVSFGKVFLVYAFAHLLGLMSMTVPLRMSAGIVPVILLAFGQIWAGGLLVASILAAVFWFQCIGLQE